MIPTDNSASVKNKNVLKMTHVDANMQDTHLTIIGNVIHILQRPTYATFLLTVLKCARIATYFCSELSVWPLKINNRNAMF